MRLHEIRELMKLMDQLSVTNLELEEEGSKLILTKAVGQAGPASPAQYVEQESLQQNQASAVTQTASPEISPAAQQPAQPTTEAPAADATAGESDANFHNIVSPMVGTFYAAPSPDADFFVKTGDVVTEKTVVCIVEAMKLMNEIEAEVEGEIAEVLVENGQLVEYGQPMFKVRLK